MPRLQILHHKSYHPYNEKNKQRVREDEAKAAAAELAREQRDIDADSSARLMELRRRAGSPSAIQSTEAEADEGDLPSTSALKDGAGSGSSLVEKHRKAKAREEKREKKRRERLDFDFPTKATNYDEVQRPGARGGSGREEGEEDVGRDKSWQSGGNGHINFFSEFENGEASASAPKHAPSLAEIAKKKAEVEMDKFTLYLGRPDRETKPWYADKELKRVEDKEVGEEAEFRRERDKRKDARSKDRNDPLTQVNTLLSNHQKSNPHPHAQSRSRPQNPPSGEDDMASARIRREQSERQRALELIAKAKAPPRRPWDDTPSSAGGGGGGGRSWAESLEREKDRAGRRYFAGGQSERVDRGWDGRPRARGGRTWDV